MKIIEKIIEFVAWTLFIIITVCTVIFSFSGCSPSQERDILPTVVSSEETKAKVTTENLIIIAKFLSEQKEKLKGLPVVKRKDVTYIKKNTTVKIPICEDLFLQYSNLFTSGFSPGLMISYVARDNTVLYFVCRVADSKERKIIFWYKTTPTSISKLTSIIIIGCDE